MKKLLKIQNLTKIYSMGSIFSRIKITAVEDVSFTVNEPEIFTLAGESVMPACRWWRPSAAWRWAVAASWPCTAPGAWR
ncbi:MAG: hypothetical protein ACK40Q_06020, partial [Pseudothermotoga sp.]